MTLDSQTCFSLANIEKYRKAERKRLGSFPALPVLQPRAWRLGRKPVLMSQVVLWALEEGKHVKAIVAISFFYLVSFCFYTEAGASFSTCFKQS